MLGNVGDSAREITISSHVEHQKPKRSDKKIQRHVPISCNLQAWEYWEPDTDSEEEGDPIVPRESPLHGSYLGVSF